MHQLQKLHLNNGFSNVKSFIEASKEFIKLLRRDIKINFILKRRIIRTGKSLKL